MKKTTFISMIIITAVILLAVFILNRPAGNVSEETAQCIGENSKLYVQFGCTHCDAQEDLFGKSYKFLNVTDCFYEIEKCEGVERTPTWIINDEEITGVQSIETLKELTGCQ